METSAEIAGEQQSQLQPQQAAAINQLPPAALRNQPQIAISPAIPHPLATAAAPLAVVAGQPGIVAVTSPFIAPAINPAVINPVMNAPGLVNPMQHYAPPFNIPPTITTAQPTPTMWPNAVVSTMQNMDPARQALVMMIEPETRNAAAEWQEYKSQDGKPYYFSVKTKQSVWDKPQALIDFEGSS